MTLIECYTASHIDNLAACLRLQPDRMILVGNADETTPAAERYQALLQKRRIPTELILCDMTGQDFIGIYRLLKQLIGDSGECVIDLTGGNELVIMAVGAVVAELDHRKRSKIRVQRYDRASDHYTVCCGSAPSVPQIPASLTVEELLFLHGGALHPDNSQPPEDYTVRALDRLWSLVAEDPRRWNRSVAQLNELESRTESNGLSVSIPIELLKRTVSGFEDKEEAVRTFLSRLHRCGAIEDRSTRDRLEYTYASTMMRCCLQKAGNALELKVLLEGRAATENGAPFFQDCRMSVGIDWDGILHNPMARIPETRNEIDVVMIHNMTPLFISCKNGQIGEEELYKLHTVATRFGGPNVKKMLIATELNQKSAFSNRAFMQRAWDMDIFLVTDAADLNNDEWAEILRRAVN